MQSRYYNPETGRFLNADALTSTGQGLLGNNMFAYCYNSPVNKADNSGYVPMIATVVGGVVVGAIADAAIKRIVAKKKYNSETVSVYERGSKHATKKKVNAEVYHPTGGGTNIHIEESLQIKTRAEQNAVLDVIMESPLYDKKTFGSKRFMRAQWKAHNVCHSIASSGEIGYKLMSWLSGSDNPIESSVELDFRSNDNFSRRQKALYTMISWIY